MIMIESMSSIGTNCTCENEYKKTEFVLRSIDEPIYSNDYDK
jgi:hypothetical protein